MTEATESISLNVDFSPQDQTTDADSKHISVYNGHSLGKHDDVYERKKSQHKTIREKLKEACINCDKHKVLRSIEKKLPGIQVIRTYKFREYILGDVISGVSVGILTVPLSMGFALLAAVPPILGLYTCLYPAFIYFIFGASRHIGMGTMAISSLVIATAVEQGTSHLEHDLKEADANNKSSILADLEHEQISIAVSITFLSGIFLLGMSVLRLGFIVSYIGNSFISGYMTATNMRVMTHQIILCLGLKQHLDTHVGFLHYFYLVFDIGKKIVHTNVASLVMSVITMLILVTVKYGINDRFKSRLKIPVPIEMIVVVLSIIISHFCKFHEKLGVRVVGHIPKGLPVPTMPSLHHMQSFVIESALCGVVSFVFQAMMVKLFCQRHNYPIDKPQELLASGMCNTVGGLLSCIAVSVSPPRAFLMEMTGGRTQVAYLINALFILLTLFALAPLLKALPLCILGCLIMTSCFPLFVHYKASVIYWRTNKYDFAIWLITTLATLCFNVEIGMVCGVAFSFMVVIYQSHNPYTSSLGLSTTNGLTLDMKQFEQAKVIPGVRIFKFDSPLYFATLGVFREKLFSSTISPTEMKLYLQQQKQEQKKRAKALKRTNKNGTLLCNGDQGKKENDAEAEGNVSLTVEGNNSNNDGCSSAHDMTPLKVRNQTDDTQIDSDFPPFTDVHTVIVDCSAIPFADTSGVKFLTKFYTEYEALGIRYVVASLNEQVRNLMGRVVECQVVLTGHAYPSVQDAILAASKGHYEKAENQV